MRIVRLVLAEVSIFWRLTSTIQSQCAVYCTVHLRTGGRKVWFVGFSLKPTTSTGRWTWRKAWLDYCKSVSDSSRTAGRSLAATVTPVADHRGGSDVLLADTASAMKIPTRLVTSSWRYADSSAWLHPHLHQTQFSFYTSFHQIRLITVHRTLRVCQHIRRLYCLAHVIAFSKLIFTFF